MAEPRWRVGRKLGRTLYLDGQCVGMVYRPDLAADIVASMNAIGVCRDCGKTLEPGYNMCERCASAHGP